MKSALSIAFLVVVCGLSFRQPVQSQEPLRWSLQKGEKFTLQMKQQTDSLVNLSSKKLTSKVDLQVHIGWEVTSAEAETFVIEQTIDSIRIEMKGPDQDPVIYDSREKKALVGAAKDFAGAGNEDRAGTPAHKIAVKGDLEIAPQAAAAKGAPKLKTQTHSGSAWFAKEPGRLIAAETSQRLVTESQYRDSTITVDLTTTLSTTLTPHE
jgi:hypothetical protein